MRRKFVAVFSAILALSMSVIGVGGSASAASLWTYYSVSGGSQLSLVGSLVASDLTARSGIGGITVPNSTGNAVASASVPGLVSVGAITTSQAAVAYGDGIQVTSTSKTAGINLLNGAIKADALEVTNVVRATSSGFTHAVDSKLVNLTIGGQSIPIAVSPNTTITIPGLAKVVTNQQSSAQDAAAISSQATALTITLLTDVADGKVGSIIKLNPTSVIVVSGNPSNALPVGGFAYGTYAAVKAADVKVQVPATALLQVPSVGTGGKTYINRTAAVDAPGLANIGVNTTHATATTIPGYADVVTGAETAKINLLSGLITADAIKVRSHINKTATTHLEEQSTELVNLKIAGKAIPINVAPNTAISVAGVGIVYVNEQVHQAGYSLVVGLRVIISTAGLGIPVGTDIQVSVASSYVAG